MLIGVIESFKTGDYTFTRRAPSTRVDGRTVLGAQSTIGPVSASIQPVSDDLNSLPEGSRADAYWVIYCATELKVDDRFIDDEGQLCRITGRRPWREWGMQHWVAYAAKEQKP